MTIETAIARPDPGQVLERVIVDGDLSRLTPAERVNYYNEVCRSLALNPFTKPFEYLRLNGKLTLYAAKNATDQLRRMHGISVTKLEVSDVQGVYVVTAYGKDKDGRVDSAQGAVYIKNLQGDDLANGMMKCETKAKRRLTLSMCGLGFMDVSEVDTVSDARRVTVDHVTGEVLDEPQAASVVGDVMVRSADERVWQRYVEVLGVAQGLGIRVKPMRLPLERQVLIDEGQRLVQAIDERKAEVEPQEPDPELDAALAELERLRAEGMDLRVPGLGKYKADRSWPYGAVKEAISNLRIVIDERRDEADLRAAAGQTELPGVKRSTWASETPARELAREMVALDRLIVAAVKERDFLQAHDLEHTRLLIMEKRSELLRRQWEVRRLEALEA